MEGTLVDFTMDTGASKTVISTKVFDRIETNKRPQLVKSACLRGAGGMPIKEKGKAELMLRLGSLEIIREAVVADIEDEVLLGYDILGGSDKEAADILLSKNKIVLDSVEIPCFQIGKKGQTRKVVVADDVKVPGLTESLVDVYVERQEDDDADVKADYLLEPNGNFKETYPLVMASSLVNINEATTCKVRILNPYATEFVMRQDAEIGIAERIERIVSVVADAESEETSLESIRRINVGPSKSEMVTPSFEKATEDEVPDHLQALFEKSAKGKTVTQRQALAGLLVKYKDTFSKDEWDIGLTDLAEHPIKTGDASPVKQRPRRVPLAHADEERKAIEDLLKKGVIQKSSSPWSSPIVLVKKKSGAIRPCVDYRRVNSLVKPDGFPLPRIQDCLDAVAGSSLFSSFDLTSGYFQIPLKKEDIPKSAFCCKFGQFEMTRMPFGLNNAASTFQRTMELALQGLQWITCLVYIDDIIVYAENFDQHISRVDEVLNRIKSAGLKLKPEKCNMLQTEVVFLGHVVSKDGVRPDPTNIAKVVQWPVPQNAKQVKQFVATGSYYRKFVKNFAKIVRPLTELTKKGKEFVWDEACEHAFLHIKKCLISTDIMGYPMNEAGQFFLDVDASGVGIGGVLAQEQEGRERVIAYASRAMNKAEKNYCITEKELLAVVYFIQYFRQYLLGRKFIVRTDHQALVWLFKLKEPSGKIARWIEILAPYDFIIEYRPGTKQGHCDALSRCEAPRDCNCDDVDMSEPLKCGPCQKCIKRGQAMLLEWKDYPAPALENIGPATGEAGEEDIRAVHEEPQPSTSKTPMPSSQNSVIQKGWLDICTPEMMSAEQKKDPDLASVIDSLERSERPTNNELVDRSPATRHYVLVWESLSLQDGVLYRTFRGKDEMNASMQLVVPSELRSKVMHQMHDSLTAGHMGVKKTKARTAQHYYWYNMREDIALYVKSCDTCAADKKPNKSPRAPLGRVAAGAPWDVLAIDYTGPFPISKQGNRYILVLTDHFTKYVEVIPVPNQTAEDCASRIMNDIIARWGTPVTIHSDQGTTFESRVFKELCRILQVKKTRTSARNPQCNGQVERFNRTLVKMVKAYLVGEQDEWDLHLGLLAGAYRATPNEATKLTPNLMTIGREVRLPADLIFGYRDVLTKDPPSNSEYVQMIRSKMDFAHRVARKHLSAKAKRSKEYYDHRQIVHAYQVGDLVWCLHETRKVGVMPKLEKAYDGPYPVKEKRSELNFVIQINNKGQDRLVHHNKLKPYEGSRPPSWVAQVSKALKRQ